MIRAAANCLALAALLAYPTPGRGQTPEQRYADWASPPFPASEYGARRTAALEGLRARGGGVLLVPSADGITHGETFRQLDDFLYFTGLELPSSLLALEADAGVVTLFLPPRDARLENPGRANDFPGRTLGDDPAVAGLSGIELTRATDGLAAALEVWVHRGSRLLVNAGSPEEVDVPRPPYVGNLGPVASLVLRLGSELPGAEIGNAFGVVASLRTRKSDAEVTTCRREGATRIPFTPIVRSGPNSPWPWRILAAHTDRRIRVLRDGDVVILDVGCEVEGYVSDVGRSLLVGGRFTDVQRRKLEMITRVSDAVIAAVRPGVRLADLTRIAYATIPDEEEPYMQTPSWFGHHIGLSAGDPALPDEPLAPGMVFTVVPWYYNHDLGVSVFVEDVVLVTPEGAEVLTRSLPRSPDELERMVR